MINKYLLSAFVGICVLVACDNNEGPGMPEIPEEKTQSFTLRVESVGEASYPVETRANAGRPLFSTASKQAIDRVEFLILKYGTTAEVVYRGCVDRWSDTDNQTSATYTDGINLGRQVEIVLKGDDLLEDGQTYVVYGVGYHTDSYGGYEPFPGVKVGDSFARTESVTVPSDEAADEIFAGAELLRVENGEIRISPNSYSEEGVGTVILRRQVGGTFGYFTHIPTTVTKDGVNRRVATLRLVTTRRNKTAILAGFRSMEDPENFAQENVINGTTPRTDYDACLDGSTVNDAFVVYDISLAKWFPGDGDLPLDANGDGYLDREDENWQMDTSRYPDNTIKLRRGSVFGDSFLIASAMYDADIQGGLPTFQMQMLDIEGRILRSWNVLLRERLAFQETRTLVSLDANGTVVITTEPNPETEYCYSLVRNHLYAMGSKANDFSNGGDAPVDLAATDTLVVDVQNEWGGGDLIYFN